MTPPRESPHLAIRTRQRRLFQSLVLGIFGLLAIVATLSSLASGVDDSTWRALALLVLLGVALLILRAGSFTPAVSLVIAVVVLAGGRQLAETGLAAFGASLLPFTVAIVIAGVLLGRRALFLTAGATVAWTVAVYVLEQRGVSWIAWGHPSNEGLDSVLLFVVVLIALLIVLERFGLSYKRALLETAEREEELRLAAAAAPIGIWSWDFSTGAVEYTPELKVMMGLSLDSRPTVETYLAHVHPDDRERIAGNLAAARTRGPAGVTEMRLVREDGSVLWVNAHSRTITDSRGEPVRALGVIYDVTRDRHARERLALLAEAGRVLGESLDVRDTLGRVARLIVPYFADWMVIDLTTPRGALERAVVHHRDPALAPWAEEFGAEYPPDVGAPHDAYHVLQRMEPVLLAEVGEERLREASRDDRHLAFLRRGGVRSLISVPMISRGRPVGVVTFVVSDNGRTYDASDLEFATQLASRVAVALDNARLFGELSDLTDDLERRVQERTGDVQRLVAEVTTAEARERHRIARLLHDELQQQLHAMQIMLQGVRASTTGALGGELDEMEETLREASLLTRHLTTDLSPPTLDGDDFVPVLHWVANVMQERHRLDVQVESPASLRVRDIAVRALLHSLLQELLFNVVKHADVNRAHVELQEAAGTLSLVVADEGEGFDPTHAAGGAGPTGFGLGSAGDRVRLFGGTLHVASRPGDGTRVTIQLPLAGLS